MAEDRIGELRIRIRTATVGDERALRREVERFARAVLERALQRLEERAPGRRVFLRQLPLQWHLGEEALGDELRIEALAEELAASLERSLPPPADAPSPSADAVVFQDEAHHLASYLAARARGERAWFHRSLEQAPGLETLAASRRADAAEALELLAARGELAEVLAGMPARELHALTAALGSDSPTTPSSLPRAEERAPRAPRTSPSLLRSRAEPYRELPALARAVALQVEARRLTGPGASSAEVARALEEAWSAAGEAEARARTGDSLITPAPEAVDGPPVGTARTSASSRARPAESLDEARTPASAATLRTKPPSSQERPPGPQERPPAESEPPPTPTVATRFGGLFYLLSPLLELEIPEALWKACLPEGEVLAYLARELLGPEGDRAAALLGGVPPPELPPAVAPEQQTEFTSRLTAQLVAAIPRRGLASLPEVVVGLHEHPAGRLLCAAASGSPFALFAWPAAAREELATGLRQLLAAWPASARLHAPPALAAAAPAGRLQPLPRKPSSVPLHLPRATTPAAAALLAQAIGAPCQLLLSRSAEQVESADAFTARFLARNARVSLPAGHLLVTFAGADIDLALRKPGLDRDPGWLAWLERTARFDFETDEL
jgi:hypothetical protein